VIEQMTEEHLTFGQIEDYAAGRLPAERIPALHQHADVCSSCREMLAAMAIASEAEHLAEQQAVDFVAGFLPEGEKTRIAGHLNNCPFCAAMVADLQEFRESAELEPAPTRPAAVRPGWSSLAWALPIAAALLVVAGISVWLALGPSHAARQVTAQLRDADGVLQLGPGGTLTGSAALPPGATQLLAAALRTRHLPQGPAELLTEPRETLRSDGANAGEAALRVLSPDGIRVVSDRPEFRWAPLTGASSYEVAVFGENFNAVARSGLIHGAVWTPPAPLPRRQSLLWQVAAMRNGVRITAPAPPETFSRFEIISADAARQIADALGMNPPSHLLLAVLYSQAGLSEEAASEVNAIAALNPGSALASSLREGLPAVTEKK
jgi:hypothetical protein